MQANLLSANLQDAMLTECYFRGADLRSAHLQTANLTNANLEGANLEGANLERANLERANLMGANLKGANLRRVDLRLVKVSGHKFCTTVDTLTHREPHSMLAAMFSGRHTVNKDSEKGYVFVDRDGLHFRHILNWLRDGVTPNLSDVECLELLREAEYYQLLGLVDRINEVLNKKKKDEQMDTDLTRTDIIKYRIKYAGTVNLRGVNLSGLDLSKLGDSNSGRYACYSELRSVVGATCYKFGVVFMCFYSNMNGSDMHNIRFYRLVAFGLELCMPQKRAKLDEASFTRANLLGANLQDACMTRCNLYCADLRSAHLQTADLTHANLEGANLEGANLKGAKLNKANLKLANLQRADLRDVK
ncbi:hypothetical protein M8C21_005981, partial [Ambrosia artemisiifolia]